MDEQRNGADVDSLAELFKESFPDVGCLRCGNGDFFILPSARQTFILGENASPRLLPVMTLACTRCGHIEQHLSDPLREAKKPIDFEGPGTR